MTEKRRFKGFPNETVTFLIELSQNNDKGWFDAHRQDYESYYLPPAKEFVIHLGDALRQIAPGIHAEPALNKSIFRIHRDVRFSKDKSPYKAHLAVFLWEGSRPKRMECPGFYFHLEPPNLMIGHGIHTFPKPHLEAYRKRVAQPEHGKALSDALQQLASKKIYNFGSQRYKRLPTGYDLDYRYADLLLNKGLTVGIETLIPDELYSPELIEYCMLYYVDMAPIHTWLLEMLAEMDR